MKKVLKRILRFFGLMLIADRLRFFLVLVRNRKSNRAFTHEYPEVVLPPDYLMYESFQLDYKRYYVNGKKTAEWLIELVKPFLDFKNTDILDWGCGPGRVIRHLPELLPQANAYSGTDYNARTIEWCTRNLKAIRFTGNELQPPLGFRNESFNLIYGISIFTHLSQTAHEEWLNELFRILRQGGVLFLTLHGNAFREKLEPAELETYNSHLLVTRGQVKEGHRTFVAFHPPEYVKNWASKFEILRHVPGKVLGESIEQDVWIFKKLTIRL